MDIDADVLALAKELATREKRTAGAVISALARRGYAAGATDSAGARGEVRNGVQQLPRRGEPITLAHVNRILDEEAL